MDWRNANALTAINCAAISEQQGGLAITWTIFLIKEVDRLQLVERSERFSLLREKESASFANTLFYKRFDLHGDRTAVRTPNWPPIIFRYAHSGYTRPFAFLRLSLNSVEALDCKLRNCRLRNCRLKAQTTE